VNGLARPIARDLGSLPPQRFQSDTERRFEVLLENDADVVKWFKPGKEAFQIYLKGDARYESDFVVETKSSKLICEIKATKDLETLDVQTKAKACCEVVRICNDPRKAGWRKTVGVSTHSTRRSKRSKNDSGACGGVYTEVPQRLLLRVRQCGGLECFKEPIRTRTHRPVREKLKVA
jgi:hypothetical protein